MSRNKAAKKARRKKRQEAQDARWIPDEVIAQLSALQDAVTADLVQFDERITVRGWEFDEEQSDDDFAVWFYEPSGAEVDDGLPVTSLWLEAEEDGEIAHVVFVGTVDRHSFTHDELFKHLEKIEAYRNGAPAPAFG